MGGIQPLALQDILSMGEKVLQLSPSMLPFFVRVMERTDDEVVAHIRSRRPSKR